MPCQLAVPGFFCGGLRLLWPVLLYLDALSVNSVIILKRQNEFGHFKRLFIRVSGVCFFGCTPTLFTINNIQPSPNLMNLPNTLFLFFSSAFNVVWANMCFLWVPTFLKLVCQGRTGNRHELVLPKKQTLLLCQSCNPCLLMCYSNFERSYSKTSYRSNQKAQSWGGSSFLSPVMVAQSRVKVCTSQYTTTQNSIRLTGGWEEMHYTW